MFRERFTHEGVGLNSIHQRYERRGALESTTDVIAGSVDPELLVDRDLAFAKLFVWAWVNYKMSLEEAGNLQTLQESEILKGVVLHLDSDNTIRDQPPYNQQALLEVIRFRAGAYTARDVFILDGLAWMASLGALPIVVTNQVGPTQLEENGFNLALNRLFGRFYPLERHRHQIARVSALITGNECFPTALSNRDIDCLGGRYVWWQFLLPEFIRKPYKSQEYAEDETLSLIMSRQPQPPNTLIVFGDRQNDHAAASCVESRLRQHNPNLESKYYFVKVDQNPPGSPITFEQWLYQLERIWEEEGLEGVLALVA